MEPLLLRAEAEQTNESRVPRAEQSSGIGISKSRIE